MGFKHLAPEIVSGSWTRYIDKYNESQLVLSEDAPIFDSKTGECASTGDILEEVVEGFGCRLSAPGYLDCTEWDGVYATEREAAQALVDAYADAPADELDKAEEWYFWAEDFDPEGHLGLERPTPPFTDDAPGLGYNATPRRRRDEP